MKNKDVQKFLLALLFATSSLPAFAGNTESMAAALKAFKTGEYLDAISNLEKIRGNKKVMGARHYLEGLCHARVQSFDKAAVLFEKAIANGNRTDDIFYEYGQALYANNELIKSRNAFQRSYNANFKKTSSLYYMAHISQVLEEHTKAKKYFVMLINNEKDDKNILQVSNFQLGESFLALAEKRENARELVEKFVLPRMRKAEKIIPKGNLADDIRTRIKELERQYYLDPNLMRNGKTLPEKRWSSSFSQEIKYDNNITQSTDSPSTQATQKDSYIYDTTFNTRYTASFKGLYTSAPGLRLRHTLHSDRKNSAVFLNDAYSIIPSLNNTYEHKLFDDQASLLLNVEYNYTARDREGKKKKIFYARSTTWTLGEKFKIFQAGPSTFKLKFKDYSAYDKNLHNKTNTVSVDQLGINKYRHVWIFFLSADFIDTYNDPQSATNSYLFRFDYIVPEILPRYTLNLAYALTMLDTKLQKPTRGMEKTHNPSIKVTKNVSKSVSFTMSYDYTKNISKDKETYSYSKHITGIELKVSF